MSGEQLGTRTDVVRLFNVPLQHRKHLSGDTVNDGDATRSNNRDDQNGIRNASGLDIGYEAR
jgi:hypothetical protein